MTTWKMPIEGNEQERLWLAWPSSGYTLGETEVEADEARATWAAVANAASEFQNVTVVVDPSDSAIAKKHLGWLAYVTPIARSVIVNRLFHLDYRVDQNRVRSSRAHTVIVGNCGTLTGNMLLIPSAAAAKHAESIEEPKATD